MNKSIFQSAILVMVISLLTACGDDEPIETPEITSYVVGIEGATGTDVLVSVEDISEGTISPVGQGIEQPAWMSFADFGNVIAASGYSSDNITTGYQVVEGELIEIGTLITELGLYSYTNVDDNTALAMGVTRAGFEDRIIYTFDKTDMSIASRAHTRIDERQEEGLVAFPTDMAVRNGKLFVSYYLMGAGGDVPAFATPNSNQARVAVYSYPDMTFEKIITDDRSSDIGNYLSNTALEIDENDDIYTFSTSSNATGFFPTPTNPSGFLRIKKGETEFDGDYFFNFEEASGGYKINNAVYAGNGKMVVRMIKDDSGLWASYDPVTEDPICEIGIADLNTKTVTVVSDVPKHGGEWGIAHLVMDGKVHLNISSATGAHIYSVDPETATAEKGAEIEGNWTKGIFASN